LIDVDLAPPAWLAALSLSLLLHSVWWTVHAAAPTTAPQGQAKHWSLHTRSLSPAPPSDDTPSATAMEAATVTAAHSTSIASNPGLASQRDDSTPRSLGREPDLTPPPAEPDDEALFLPRTALTLAPAASMPVLLDFPSGVADGHYTTELTLFIDETGQVRKVRMDGPALPDALESLARQAFLNTHFSPGEVQGRAVRARIRIVLEFSSDPQARPAGTP